MLQEFEGVSIGDNLNDTKWQQVYVAFNTSHLIMGLNNIYTRTENQKVPQHEIAPLLQKMPSVNDFEIREDASGFYSSGHFSSSFEEPIMADELDLDHYNDITRSGLVPSYPAEDAVPAEAQYIDIESSIDQFLEANGPRKESSKF